MARYHWPRQPHPLWKKLRSISVFYLQWIKLHLRYISPPVWLIISVWTMYDEYIQVNRQFNSYAPITLLLSMVWFRNCNSLLSLFFSCYVGDLTQVQIKATTVSISGFAWLVLHNIFSMIEWKSSAWIFGSVGESGLISCIILFHGDNNFGNTSSSKINSPVDIYLHINFKFVIF